MSLGKSCLMGVIKLLKQLGFGGSTKHSKRKYQTMTLLLFSVVFPVSTQWHQQPRAMRTSGVHSHLRGRFGNRPSTASVYYHESKAIARGRGERRPLPDHPTEKSAEQQVRGASGWGEAPSSREDTIGPGRPALPL